MANPFQTTDQGASDAYKRSLQNKSKSDKKKEYAKKMSVKHDTKRTGFSKTAKDLLEPKKGEKHLKGYEY